MPSLLKTGIKYGAIFGAAKVITDGYSKSQSNSANRGQYSTGPLQSEYTHESWCNGCCGDRCRSQGQQSQQAREAQYQPQNSQNGWTQSGYVHQAGCKGGCNLRCCDNVAPRQWEPASLPMYQQY